LNPIAFYTGAALSLLTSTGLFVHLKLEIARSRALAEVAHVGNESETLAIRTLKAELEKLRETVAQLEAARAVRPPAAAGINLTRRAQVLRMYCRGESIPSIAAMLETPSNEVALLLKLHSITNGK
jgi:hypothetical protein